MRRLLSLGAALAVLSSPTAAETVWLCGLSDDLVRLVCVADSTDETEPAPVTARVNGTSFPLDPRRRFVVDLWSPPNELAAVETLAQATICYRSPGCRAILAMPALQARWR